MTESARTTRWVLAVMPDGYRVRATAYYDQFEDAASLFAMPVEGIGERGERVTVRGNHIARAWREPVTQGPQHPPSEPK